MSYPPPPDLKSSQSSTPQPHPSLPARPPPPTSSSFKPAFSTTSSSTARAPGVIPYNQSQATTTSNNFVPFKPRSVAAQSSNWNSTPHNGSAPPSYSSTGYVQDAYQQQSQQQLDYAQQPQQTQYYQQYGTESYAGPTPPQIRNPFPAPDQTSHVVNGQNRRGQNYPSYDQETEAQIAQWQSAYAPNTESSTQKGSGATGPQSAGGANAVALGSRGTNTSATLSNQEVASVAKSDSGVASVVSGPDGNKMTVVRSGGGQTWQDPSLLEWDPAHFRLFVGNLAGEVTDDSLLKAFSKYESVQKARVVRDKRTTKSKGYGFVSFSNGDQYFQAAKEMQGKYIGSHPVLLRRSTTEIRPTIPADKNKNKKGKGEKGGNNTGNANTGAGVSKKQPKTKGGLKLLG